MISLPVGLNQLEGPCLLEAPNSAAMINLLEAHFSPPEVLSLLATMLGHYLVVAPLLRLRITHHRHKQGHFLRWARLTIIIAQESRNRRVICITRAVLLKVRYSLGYSVRNGSLTDTKLVSTDYAIGSLEK